ncbi:MAG: GHMP kinase [Candidatus Pacearchaeota archaeon]
MALDGNFDLAKSVIMEMNPKTGLELFFRNDILPRSGLGSSAAAFVSIISAFNVAFGKKLTKHEIAQLAYDIERNKLKIKGGKQDQFASAYGGLNFMKFKNNSVKVSKVNISKGTLLELEKCLLLVFIGKRKKDGHDIIADQTNSLVSGNKQVSNALDSTKQIAIEMYKSLKSGNIEEFGKLLNKAWIEKKKYSPYISNKYIDKIYSAAIDAGAIGGKITGAGGGGHMIFCCYNEYHKTRFLLQNCS